MLKNLNILSFFIAFNLFAQTSYVQMVSSTSTGFNLEYTFGEIQVDRVYANSENYSRLSVPGLTKPYDIGNPDLPVLSKLIEVPLHGKITFEVLNSKHKIVDLAAEGYADAILPSQPSLFKSQKSTEVPFVLNKATYSKNNYYAQNLITIERLGVMRGKAIARIQIAPIAYNAITNELKIVESLELNVNFENSISSLSSAYRTPDFEANFSKLLNSNSNSYQEFSSNTTRMIILSDPQFEQDLQPFIRWKTRKGFDVIEAYKGQEEVGSTKESMKAYIQSFYDNATVENPAPTYLLIVGDHELIPSFEAGNHVSDMYYCEFTGDYFPEMIFGRFSANNQSELNIQIDKTLTYEKFLMPDPSYLDEILLVAGVDQNFAPTHGNGQINYGSEYYFNEAHNLIPHIYLYPETESSEVENQIIQHVSKGLGFANYTAHCGPIGWSDPSFEVPDVVGLANESQYGLMVGNCCQSNVFNGATCFGEALLRKSKAGAVGYIGGTDNTLWDEDFYWSVGNGPISVNPTYEETGLAIYDCSFHENNEVATSWVTTQGQLLQSGNMAVTESASSQVEYYWEIYHLMGDPSVLTYYGVPSELSISHPSAVPIGMTSLAVSSEQYTYVAVSQNGVLLDAKYTDQSGSVTLSFDPLATLDVLEVVATKQNKQVYIGAVNIFSSEMPYVTCSSITISNGSDQTNQFEVNETFVLNMNLENFGSTVATGLNIEVTSSNPNVTLAFNPILVDSISGQSNLSLTDSVTIELNTNFSDQESVLVSYTISDSQGEVWTSYSNILVNAPNLDFSGQALSNGETFINFGETVDLVFALDNIGHAISAAGFVSVSSDLASLTIHSDSITFTTLEIDSTILITIPVTLNTDALEATSYTISVEAVNLDGFTANSQVLLETPYCSAESMDVEIIIETDYAANETSWTLSNSTGDILAEVEPNDLDNFQTYSELVCLSRDQHYTFEIQDEYGDGIQWGGYTISICDETIASENQFGNSDMVNFISNCDQTLETGCTDPEASNFSSDALIDDGSCLLSVGLEELVNSIKIYPNPAKSTIAVNLGSLKAESIIICQLEGKQVFSVPVFDSKTSFNISSLEDGFYLIRIKLQNGQVVSRSIVVM